MIPTLDWASVSFVAFLGGFLGVVAVDLLRLLLELFVRVLVWFLRVSGVRWWRDFEEKRRTERRRRAWGKIVDEEEVDHGN